MPAATSENVKFGHCLCKATSFTIPNSEEPALSFIFHFRDCQRNARGPYQVVVISPTSAIPLSNRGENLKDHMIPKSSTLSGYEKSKTSVASADAPFQLFR
ncbi:hypothetical protein K432DRAFT_376697 [Lepidopterella palustris CBS 459.81]|uniref:CENP-V/GFA domain-containing protein n=1 Tax=Lepidopterella palustris CBS 459.81 TaxID=1314670 RepID=A0A8E2EMA1_9PEZI|nr:hypothetical protein K432DRAFT_376697 [Lepidopterella palustris CBS 459.81]